MADTTEDKKKEKKAGESLREAAETLYAGYLGGKTYDNAASAAANTAAGNAAKLMDMAVDAHGEAKNYASSLEKQMNDLYDRLTGGYEQINGYVTSDYYDTDEAKSILAEYRRLGGLAAASAAASAAGDNSGNLDSYAAAQAKRQQLAYTDAGQEAARAQKNDNVDALLSNLKLLGTGTGDLQERELKLLTGRQDRAADLTDAYGKAEGDALDAGTTVQKNLQTLYTDILAQAGKEQQMETDERMNDAKLLNARLLAGAEKTPSSSGTSSSNSAANAGVNEISVLRALNNGKADTSNPAYLSLYRTLSSIMRGTSELSEGTRVSPEVAKELLLLDGRYAEFGDLIDAIVGRLQNS